MTPSSLRILSSNVRGFRTNVGELTHAALKNKADIVVAVETFLNDSSVTTCDRIPGYTHWVRRDRTAGQGGGIALCHREGLQLQLLPVTVPEEMEMLFFRLLLADRTAVLLCPLYRPQCSLDPVLTDLPADSVQCYQLDKVLCEVGLNPASEEGSQRTIWLWEKANWRGLRAELASTYWESTFTDDMNHNVATLTSLIISAQARHVPHRAYRVDPRDQPWFGYRCRQAADAKYKAWTRLKRRPSRRHKAQHRAACKNMARVATWARQRWELSLRRKLASNQTDPKQWWSLVKQRQGTVTQERIPPLKTASGNLAVANQDKAELLAAHFSGKMTTEEPDSQPPQLTRLCDVTLDHLQLSEAAVTKLLRSTDTRKAPGPDDVSPFLMKHCAEELTKPLTHIFRQCLQTSTWPAAWKEARVTPVHTKKG
ncbi:uncharacterized protein LOC123505177 [Portunus trituberculatus]|uniref:uncharacterized protein LOC123505177 n=1 Tax=Portunus trituberculatus TaxID=210409 RepID=UPI001E1CC100|nr:uncharacterized protein LOC123505177 [Portunus trituberculatus]